MAAGARVDAFECFFEHAEVVPGFLGGADAAGGFHADEDALARCASRIASSITSVTGIVAAGLTLPVLVLMNPPPGSSRRLASSIAAIAMSLAGHVVERFGFARLEDHLEMHVPIFRPGIPAEAAHREDLVTPHHACPKETPRLMTMSISSAPSSIAFSVSRAASSMETRRDRGDLDAISPVGRRLAVHRCSQVPHGPP